MLSQDEESGKMKSVKAIAYRQKEVIYCSLHKQFQWSGEGGNQIVVSWVNRIKQVERAEVSCEDKREYRTNTKMGCEVCGKLLLLWLSLKMGRSELA